MGRRQGQQAQVIYRGTTLAGRSVELHFTMEPAAAGVGDAWRRLTAAHSWIDPMSLEIEIYEGGPVRRRPPLPGPFPRLVAAAAPQR